jgi:hypothetical protein
MRLHVTLFGQSSARRRNTAEPRPRPFTALAAAVTTFGVACALTGVASCTTTPPDADPGSGRVASAVAPLSGPGDAAASFMRDNASAVDAGVGFAIDGASSAPDEIIDKDRDAARIDGAPSHRQSSSVPLVDCADIPQLNDRCQVLLHSPSARGMHCSPDSVPPAGCTRYPSRVVAGGHYACCP